jgi:DNA-directed RNA polymerase subunit H (RpoH/RPB5)
MESTASNSKPIKQNLVQVIMNDSQVKELIILNTVKMFINRGIIDENHQSIYVSTASSRIDQNDETYIELSSDETQRLGQNKIHIKFIDRKITTIRKVIDIEDFMDKPEYKIVVVNNMAQKAVKQVLEYKNTELFYDYELQINLVDHILVPKHHKLNEVEIDQLKESYRFKPKNAKRMYLDDPVARYYNLKVDDIVRIERPSITAGYSIDYRVVVAGSIHKN